jgi:soluble lytic murein transglycosylase-like protein
VTLRGRHWVALWLAAFCVTAALVVWRQTEALAAARRLKTLETTLHALEASRATTSAAIRRSRSRAVLVPLAEARLGLRLPQDTDIVILQDPRAR